MELDPGIIRERKDRYMNKNAIKKFAIEARKKLIDSVTDKAGMLGITEKSCSKPITKGPDFEVYQTVAGTEVTLNRRQCEQRRRLVSQIESRGFEAVVEEVAYTWFNRICAIRFMEVNDYLPNRVRVLSSEKEGKMEPDLVTQAPDVDLDLTVQEKEEIINWKMSGTSEDTDKMFGKLFLKQCHQLHDILPGLFEADSDYMELLFGSSYTNKDDVIYMLVNPETGIPEADFNVSTLDEEGNPTGQVEIIGWLYQYYNTELKDDTFAKLKKNVKITKERIPAATQLFTPDWIVRYMVENSVGRIWIEHLRAVDPSTDEKATAERFGWKYYLPEAEQEESVNVKLAEIRTTYKDLKPTEIICIDPCMGSGHILIAMFDVLMDIYESAGYDKREAAFEIVENNIHGLDIDQRAYQLAYFAVMMKGRGYNRRFLRGRDGKLEPKVYAIVESNEINRKHLQFFGTHLSEQERNLAVMQIEGLLDTFKDAREYGSILNVDACDWGVLEKFVDDLDITGQISFESVGSEETQNQLRKLVGVARNLGQKYDAVVTNPPYMGASGMGAKLSKYVKDNYPDSKSDLFSVFMEKSDDFAKNNGYTSLITMESWMFLFSFEKLREKISASKTIVNMVHMPYLGKGGTSLGINFGTAAVIMKKIRIPYYNAQYEYTVYYECNDNGVPYMFPTLNERWKAAKQEDFEKIPGKPVAYWVGKETYNAYESCQNLGKYMNCKSGIMTGSDKYIALWFELPIQNIKFDCKTAEDMGEYRWFPLNSGGDYRLYFGNNLKVVNLWHDGVEIRNNVKNYRLREKEYYFKKGITWGRITSSSIAFREVIDGSLFGDAGPIGFIPEERERHYILGFLCSKIALYLLTATNPTLNYQVRDIENLPMKFSQEYLEEVNSIVSENIKYEQQDWDSFEISWNFKRHPLLNNMPTEKILISECFSDWKCESDKRYNKLKGNEEKLNSIFAKIYGLQNELTSEVEEKSVTVRKAELKRDIQSFISYVVGCMFGRYSLDEDGLINAGEKWEKNRYHTFIPDNDNCIPITDEEYFSDDIVARFVEFVKMVYGADALEENLGFIADALGNKGDTSREVIRNYFLKDFYVDHLKVYQKRPIYWLFDSGKQNGFKALIYMHRYDADTVGRVRTDYLHRAQKYVETAMQSAQYTIDNASSVAEKSKATKAVTKYTKQLAEMKIYDEAIAHIANKRIEIDLDDGVKVNYEKFQGVEVAQEGKKALKVDLLAKIK